MAISYLGKTGAKQLLHETLTSALFGNPALASATEMMDYVQKVREWSAGSKTAQAIFAVVDRSERDIYLVGMKRGGFSCFSSSSPKADVFEKFFGFPPETEARPAYSAQKGSDDEVDGQITRSGVVFFDIQARFSFKERAGLDAQRNIVYRDEDNELHPYVAFLHELGHAKQFIENPLFFEGSLHNTASMHKELEDALIDRKAKQLKAENASAAAAEAKKVKAAAPPAAVGGAPVAPPPPVSTGRNYRAEAKTHVHQAYKLGGAENVGSVRTEAGEIRLARNMVKKISRPSWAVRIEADNMVSHEWPVCDEMGQPKRMTYNEISLF